MSGSEPIRIHRGDIRGTENGTPILEFWDGGHTVATPVGVRGAAADITGVATAVGVMAPAYGGGAIEREASTSPCSAQ